MCTRLVLELHQNFAFYAKALRAMCFHLHLQSTRGNDLERLLPQSNHTSESRQAALRSACDLHAILMQAYLAPG